MYIYVKKKLLVCSNGVRHGFNLPNLKNGVKFANNFEKYLLNLTSVP
jgi:hypothetical protein